MTAFRDRLDLARLANGLARAPGKPTGGVSGPSTLRSGDPTPKLAPTGSAEALRLIPVRTVPRALLDELVARLESQGFRHV